jgi:ubiquinone/menaquinone biosynthesis C-methylase UbiE
VERVCGIDPDERVVDNPYLDEGKVSMAEKIPYPAESFDLVFSDNVLEHLDYPQEVFAEIQRVLKPGGILLVKTPNKRHYMPLISRLTPHWFHRAFNRARGRREPEDTFPTRYRANSVMAFKALAKGSNLELEKVRLVEGRPEYLRFSSVTYIIGWWYERLVNRFDALAGFRILLIGKFRKPPAALVDRA